MTFFAFQVADGALTSRRQRVRSGDYPDAEAQQRPGRRCFVWGMKRQDAFHLHLFGVKTKPLQGELNAGDQAGASTSRCDQAQQFPVGWVRIEEAPFGEPVVSFFETNLAVPVLSCVFEIEMKEVHSKLYL